MVTNNGKSTANFATVGVFYCHACLDDKALAERSHDDRYCQGCYDFLLKEAEMLAERGQTKRRPWMPKPPEPPLGDDALATAKHHTADNYTRQENCNKIRQRGNHHVGRPKVTVSTQQVVAMVSQDCSTRDIAARLGVSHMTIARVLSEAKEKTLETSRVER